jgi:hypothetical protein
MRTLLLSLLLAISSLAGTQQPIIGRGSMFPEIPPTQG